MKLLCVKQSKEARWNTTGGEAPIGPVVVIGNEYESIGSMEFEDGVSYFLRGFPRDCVYHHSLFATLPDQTADEMEEEEAIANLQPA
jgi:hypothetical protein